VHQTFKLLCIKLGLFQFPCGNNLKFSGLGPEEEDFRQFPLEIYWFVAKC